MFDWLLNCLFKSWDNYEWISVNYYKDIHTILTNEEINSLIKNFRNWQNSLVKRKELINWQTHKITFKYLVKQTNNWNLSIFITVTNNYKKIQKSFHWVFNEKCWNLKDYWVYEFTYLWKNEDWFDSYRQSDTEKCYLWHWSKKNLI